MKWNVLSVAAMLVLSASCDGTSESWSPDPAECFEDQLEADSPEFIELDGDFVNSCRKRWLSEQHCYGRPTDSSESFELEWQPWAATYGYVDGARVNSLATSDVSLPKAVLGPNGTCIRITDGTVYAEVQNVWEYPTWTAESGNCTLEVMTQCECNADGEPDDPACLDITVP